jgi:gas vesicle structural protein
MERPMTVQRETWASTSEVFERVLDKGIIIDMWARIAFVGLDLMAIRGHFFVASIETYNRYADELNLPELNLPELNLAPIPAPAVKSRTPKTRGARQPGSLRIVREAFNALNRHDVQRYSAMLDDNYIGETYRTPEPLQGRDAARQAMVAHFKVLPDLRFTIQGTLATADDVLVSWLATGTPRDEYSGRPLTERRFEVPGCTVTRLRNGKIVHTWDYWDTTATGAS